MSLQNTMNETCVNTFLLFKTKLDNLQQIHSFEMPLVNQNRHLISVLPWIKRKLSSSTCPRDASVIKTHHSSVLCSLPRSIWLPCRELMLHRRIKGNFQRSIFMPMNSRTLRTIHLPIFCQRHESTSYVSPLLINM